MNLMIGDSTAEKIKKEIGTAIPSTNNTFLMKGRDIRSGTPKEIELTEKDACEAIMPILKSNFRRYQRSFGKYSSRIICRFN